MKASKLFFNISSVICFIFGALYIFSLVFIPVGVYCFIAAKRFNYKAEHLLDNFAEDNRVLKNYVIFASIVCFPFGLVSAIAYYLVTNNNISITETKEDNSEIIVETIDEKTSESEENIESVEAHIEETYEEKVEKFNKLQNFHKKGIITDEELEMAKIQLFGKDENN